MKHNGSYRVFQLTLFLWWAAAMAFVMSHRASAFNLWTRVLVVVVALFGGFVLGAITGGLTEVLIRWRTPEPDHDDRPNCSCDNCKPKPEAEPLFPYDYFTPYTTCPKCKVEGLHWMRPTLTAADLEPERVEAKTRMVMAGRMISEKPQRITTYHPPTYDSEGRDLVKELEELYEEENDRAMAEWEDECRQMAIGYLLAPERGFDVFRQCRTEKCGHEWGQKVCHFSETMAS